MKTKLFALLMLAASVPAVAPAVTLEEVLEQIKKNNADLKYASAQIEAQTAELKTTNNLSNPTIDGSYLFGNDAAGDKWEVGVSQEFDWPGLYSARGAANKAQIEAIRRSYSVTKQSVLFEAYNLCLDIVSCNRSIAFQKGVMDNLNKLYDTNMKAFSHGEVSIIDVNKLKIERIALQQTLDNLVAKRDAKVIELEGYNSNLPIEGVKTLDFYSDNALLPMSDYLAEAKANSPLIAQSRAELVADEKYTKVASAQGLPKFNLGYKHSKEDGYNFNGVTFGMSLPVFENRGKMKAAKAKYIISQYACDNAEADVENEVRTNYQTAQSLQKQLNGYREALDGVDNVSVLNKALNGGQISLLTYLQELRYFVDAKAVMLEVESDYHRALAVLNKYRIAK